MQTGIDVTTDYLFAYVFGAEAMIKLFALRPSFYFGDYSNCFDMVVVLAYILKSTLYSACT